MSETSRLPKPVASNWEWQYEGACRSLPTEMFFHPDGERGPRRKARENAAKAVCATCPVIAACRAHALAAQEPYGIWGGLTEEERLDIINKAQDATPGFNFLLVKWIWFVTGVFPQTYNSGYRQRRNNYAQRNLQ
jgi:WhiB family redox-sensing transcriptional regulator